MREDLAADVARVLAALLEARAWFRRGLTDPDLAQRANMSPLRVAAARREAELHGLVERQGAGTEHPLTMLTPSGVARARGVIVQAR